MTSPVHSPALFGNIHYCYSHISTFLSHYIPLALGLIQAQVLLNQTKFNTEQILQ